jgi:hypothetical protein
MSGDGMYGLLDALESIIKAAAEDKRKKLGEALDAYVNDFLEEFDWAISGMSPALLHHLMICVDAACHSGLPSKSGRVIRLVGRKPEGSA